MAEEIVAICEACGARLTLAQTLETDPEDDSCPKCNEDALIWIVEEEEEEDG